MLTYSKQSFLGGQNQQVDSTRLEDNEYPLLINGRNRNDVISPIYKPAEVTDPIFAGQKIQGTISVGSTLIIFANGKAYYRDYNVENSVYNQVADLQLSPIVDIIYAELVPVSSLNFIRIPEVQGQSNTAIKLTNPITASPSCLVVQDGINQPWIILNDMTTRQTKKYADWTIQNREYVPIGTQMLFSDGILYVVKGNLLLRSVTGSPLDFVVYLDKDGNKLPTEADGGAEAAGISVDYNIISSIGRMATDDGSFFVSTVKASYAVTPLVGPQDLIFGEPDYKIRFLFSAGATSPFAYLEMIGDNAFVEFNGLRSFNAILQLKNEGRNSPFSKKIDAFFSSIVQDYTAAINFDNYALFAVNTVFGRGVIIYDTINEVFPSIDIFDGVGQILKFEEVRTASEKRLFFITTDNKVFEYYASDEVAECKLYVGDWCSNDPNIEQHPHQLKLVFIDSIQVGTISASMFSDRKFGGTLTKQIAKTLDSIDQYLVPINISETAVDTVQVVEFDFSVKGKNAWKHGFLIKWSVMAKLSHVKFTAREVNNIVSDGGLVTQFTKTKQILG